MALKHRIKNDHHLKFSKRVQNKSARSKNLHWQKKLRPVYKQFNQSQASADANIYLAVTGQRSFIYSLGLQQMSQRRNINTSFLLKSGFKIHKMLRALLSSIIIYYLLIFYTVLHGFLLWEQTKYLLVADWCSDKKAV